MPETILPPPSSAEELITCERSGVLEPWDGHIECPCQRVYQVRDEHLPGYATGPCACGRAVVGPTAAAFRICRCGHASRLIQDAPYAALWTERDIQQRADERAAEQRRMDAWNAAHPIGSVIEYETGDRRPMWTTARTASLAWLGRDGGAEVRLEGVDLPKWLGCVRDVADGAEGLELGRETEPYDMTPLVAGMAER